MSEKQEPSAVTQPAKEEVITPKSGDKSEALINAAGQSKLRRGRKKTKIESLEAYQFFAGASSSSYGA
mgnify:CR=1 FL=1